MGSTKYQGLISRAGASPTPTILRLRRPIRRMVGATLAVALNLRFVVEPKPEFSPPGGPERGLEEKPGSPLSSRRWACIRAASRGREDRQSARVAAHSVP